MDEKLKKKIISLSNKELFLMVYVDSLNYSKELFSFAREELNKRQLDYSQLLQQLSNDDYLSKLPASSEELIEQSNRKDEILTEISNQPEIIEVLKQYEKDQECVKEIFWKLMACGAGAFVARSVIENPKSLAEYLQMEANRLPDMEIARKFIEFYLKLQ